VGEGRVVGKAARTSASLYLAKDRAADGQIDGIPDAVRVEGLVTGALTRIA